MAENKTKLTGASVEHYIASKANEQQRSDCLELMALLKKITRQRPKMWGPSIVGYGAHRYTYESGRTGETPLVGFAIRGRGLVIYISVEGDKQQSLLRNLANKKMEKFVLSSSKRIDLNKRVLDHLSSTLSSR